MEHSHERRVYNNFTNINNIELQSMTTQKDASLLRLGAFLHHKLHRFSRLWVELSFRVDPILGIIRTIRPKDIIP